MKNSIPLTVGRDKQLFLDLGLIESSSGTGGGEFLTRPLVFQGSTLELNLKTRGDGWVRVELQDENGQPIGGFALADSVPMNGNSIKRKASWSGGEIPGELAARPVRLHFEMRSSRSLRLPVYGRCVAP